MMHLRRSLTALPFVLIVVAAMLLTAGCGDDEQSTSKSSSTTEKAEVAGSETASSADSDDSADTADTAATGGGSNAKLTGCNEDVAMPTVVAKRNDMYSTAPTAKLDADTTYTVRFTTNKGSFDVLLDPKAGPVAAANMACLAQAGFYDGIVFHRVMEGFMVQTGDPTGTGTGGPGYAIADDEVDSTYPRGTVAMANAGPGTGGSQFFVVQGTEVGLPPDYAVFGSVDDEGMKTIDAIASVPVSASPSGEPSMPKQPIRITSAKLIVG